MKPAAKITVSPGHWYSSGDDIVLGFLHPSGVRGLIYRILMWLPIFRIEARMFFNITSKPIRCEITDVSRGALEFEVTL